MKIGDKIICIKDYNDKYGQKFSTGRVYKVKYIHTDTNVFSKPYEYINVDDNQQRTNGFPIRKKYGPVINDLGVEIGYFDRYFINLRELRRQKLLKIRNIS